MSKTNIDVGGQFIHRFFIVFTLKEWRCVQDANSDWVDKRSKLFKLNLEQQRWSRKKGSQNWHSLVPVTANDNEEFSANISR